jgi:hypothetical protein
MEKFDGVVFSLGVLAGFLLGMVLWPFIFFWVMGG